MEGNYSSKKNIILEQASPQPSLPASRKENLEHTDRIHQKSTSSNISTQTIGKKVALVIGNSDYQYVPQLRNPENDARAITDLFNSMGFETWTGLNLNQQETLDILANFAKKIITADTVIFFYSGHAVQVDEENYIIPIDSNPVTIESLKYSSINISSILRILEATSGARIIFFDSCRDNPFTKSLTRGILSTDGKGIGLARIVPRFGTMINYATAPNAVAQDGEGENSPFTEAIVKHFATPGLPLEMAMVRIRAEVALKTNYNQIPWTHSSLLREITLIPGKYVVGNLDTSDTQTISDLISEKISVGNIVRINRKEFRWMGEDATTTNQLLSFFHEGINHLEFQGHQLRIWVEGTSAWVFPNAYSESHALLIAIDDYPSATGFGPLDFMESNAEKLADRLNDLGFPPENITKLYGPQATKLAIQNALSRFWGQKIDDEPSRVVIYFGGHGTHVSRDRESSTRIELTDGLLIPYDHDPELPYHSSLVLEELRNWNMKRTRMHHTLILIDACSSGLILPKMLSEDDAGEAMLNNPARWQTIQANLRQPHSAIIVAGTGDEKALWLNGGIFTKSLIAGLEGGADLNNDGLIEFGELSFELLRSVRGKSITAGFKQTPSSLSIGSGQFFFELPER